MIEEFCTPTLDICHFERPYWNDPKIKEDILKWYVPNSTPDPNNFFQTNAQITLQKYGRVNLNWDPSHWAWQYPVEIVDAVVGPAVPGAVIFDFKQWLNSMPDLDTQSDPSQISGNDAHMNFYGYYWFGYDDWAWGGTNEDSFYGYGGNDRFWGREGNDYFEGGAGDDRIYGGSGDDIALGGDGNDRIYGQTGHDRLEGGFGDDYINGGFGNDCIDGGWGNDTIVDLFGNNIVIGGPEGFPYFSDDDRITTGWGRDYIDGGWGDDTIDSGGGNDQVQGGYGNDWINAGWGSDIVDGGYGDDRIYAGSGNDEVCGGDGDDVVNAGRGHDKVDAGSGDDKVFGRVGNDTILGGDGDDKLHGNRGNDILVDGHGNDVMRGGWGNDTLYYGEGKDAGYGGRGDDVFKFADDMVDYDAGETLGRNLVGDFQQTFASQDVIDLKCVSALTHLAVIALDDDTVRMIGYDAEEGDYFYDRSNADKIFDIYVEGDNVGFVDGGDGYLNRDTAYNSSSGPVCVNTDVLVDLGTNDDFDLDWFAVV